MRTLVISDLHLSNRFDQRKFYFLTQLIDDCDRVVINGDFWNYYECEFDAFMNSPWKALFPLLKEKQAVYLFGNHDRQQWCDGRVASFSVWQGDRYVVNGGARAFIIEHGHQYVMPGNSLSKKKIRILRAIRFENILQTVEHFVQSNRLGKAIFNLIIGRLNATIKHDRKHQEVLNRQINGKRFADDKTILVTGHTHLVEDSPIQRYINTGFINYGLASYLLIDGDDYQLVQTRY